MKKIISLFLLTGFLYIAYGLFVSFWSPEILPPVLNPNIQHKLFYDYSGAMNIHTINSTGSGNLEKIVAAAKNSGLHFIAITDLNDYSPSLHQESLYDGVLVFMGGSYGYLDSRIINFDIRTTQHLQGPGRSQMVFADLLTKENRNKPEGLFILSQPLRSGSKIETPQALGLDGIEVLNLKRIWQQSWQNSKLSFLWTALLYPFNSNLAYIRMLASFENKEVDLWDKLNQMGTFFGYAGTDADAQMSLSNSVSIEFPSYETLFSIFKNHILITSELTGNYQLDRKKISDALHNGQVYLSLDILQNPVGFEAYLSGPKNFLAPLGSTVAFQPNLDLVINLPSKPSAPFETIVYRNGEKVLSSNSATTKYTIHGPGVYRSTVQIKVPLPLPYGSTWVTWIYTNPIYIK
jgi:hypothetical protein